LVIQEAAAFNVPSVVVKNSSSAEGILDTVNGFLIENETAALAKTLSDLMEYPDTIRKAGEGARKSLYRNWETIVDEVNMKYTEILKFHDTVQSVTRPSGNQVLHDFSSLPVENSHIQV
jgi:glycosyltransferase involved in cell wall biosynthesis